MWPRSRNARLILTAGLLAGALCRVYVVFTDAGIYWPDEIHQSLEPAHRRVYGYGLVAWEFAQGARNWALPGVIALLMRACQVGGADRPEVYLAVIRLFFVTLSLATALGTYRLARILGASEPFAAVGGASWALAAPAIYFAHRALGENAAAAAAVWALSLLLTPQASRRALWWGGSLLGLAVLFRLQMGVLALGVLAIFAVRREWVALGHTTGALSVWAVVYGALDAATWGDLRSARYGGWFHSALLYVRFNFVEGRSVEWGTSPASYYLEHIFRSMPIVGACLGAGLLAGLRWATALTLLALLFLAAHSMVPHKELRFVLPMLPLAMAATAKAFDSMPRPPGFLAVALLAVGAIVSAATFRSLTWGDLGAHLDRPDQSAWDGSGAVNRLLLVANKQPDLCGLRVDIHPAWHGGASYLHRWVRLYHDTPPESGFYNYAIALAGSGLPAVAVDGDMELVKVPHVTRCVRDPGYDWSLH